MMHKVLWQLQVLRFRLSASLWLILGLVAFCLVLQTLVLPALRAVSGDVRDQLRALRNQAAGMSEGTASAASSFQRVLATSPTPEAVIRDIYDIAARRQIRLQETQIDASAESRIPVVHYRLMLRVSGNYSNIRRFIAEALERLPLLALTDVNIQGGDIAGQVEATLNMTAYGYEQK